VVNCDRGFITILIGLYSYQDCLHFLTSVRRFHPEPIVIVIDQVPWDLKLILGCFKDISFVPAPRNPNPVLASRFAKINLYQLSPFQKTIYLDSDICLLAPIHELFDALEQADCLLTPDVRPDLADAINLLRVKQNSETDHDVIGTLNAAGIPCTAQARHYNSGLTAFRKSETNQLMFEKYQEYFDQIINRQDLFLLRDQGALAAAIEFAQPQLKELTPVYNFMSQWGKVYGELPEPIKVLHCTYPIRPQYAKNITRSWLTRIFDRWARVFLPTQLNNAWRQSKAKV